jgi:hypothetical protein
VEKLAEQVLLLSEKKSDHKNLANPNLKRVYGVETFGELYDKLSADKTWSKALKEAKGWIIDNGNKDTPFALIFNDSILWLGKQGEKIQGLHVKSIFKMDELK